MPLIRKRRAPQVPDPDDDEASQAQPGEESPESPPRHRRRTEEPQSSEGSDSDDSEPRAPTSTDVMVKKLVRLALASEYSRQTIRRADITTKVLGEQGSRPFKMVFDQAQKALKTTFGMEMVELPQREKVTASQRRAAQRTEKTSSSNKSWIVCSTLPDAYRKPEIIPPTKAQSSGMESSYTALYSFVISVIMLNGGSLPEEKLDRYLRRANADTYTPVDRTDRLIERLCKEKYIVRNREMDGGEEMVEYIVGPRGKTEIGAFGVAGLVREVYGRQVAGEDSESLTDLERERMRDFEDRLRRSLGFKSRAPQGEGENGDNSADNPNQDDEATQSQAPTQAQRRQSRRQAVNGDQSGAEAEAEAEEEDEDEDED